MKKLNLQVCFNYLFHDSSSLTLDLLNDREEDNEKLAISITTPDEFLTRKQQLLTLLPQSQISLTLQQEDSQEKQHT